MKKELRGEKVCSLSDFSCGGYVDVEDYNDGVGSILVES